MEERVRVVVVGDFDETSPTHSATDESLAHAAARLGVRADVRWAATDDLARDLGVVRSADALLCAPGSPYRSLAGALRALHHGRTEGVPTLGTCGGFQHAVLEYARDVLAVTDAAHAEYDPYASRLFISQLTCSLRGRTLPVTLTEGTRAAALYGGTKTDERYYCDFGLNPEYERQLHENGLRVAGTGAEGEARVLEIAEHPYYLATLFVPQTSSTPDAPHPLLLGLLEAARTERRP